MTGILCVQCLFPEGESIEAVTIIDGHALCTAHVIDYAKKRKRQLNETKALLNHLERQTERLKAATPATVT